VLLEKPKRYNTKTQKLVTSKAKYHPSKSAKPTAPKVNTNPTKYNNQLHQTQNLSNKKSLPHT